MTFEWAAAPRIPVPTHRASRVPETWQHGVEGPVIRPAAPVTHVGPVPAPAFASLGRKRLLCDAVERCLRERKITIYSRGCPGWVAGGTCGLRTAPRRHSRWQSHRLGLKPGHLRRRFPATRDDVVV